MGSSVSKAALGATTEEFMEPEPKHLADLIQYINETNKSIDPLADVLSEKTRSSSWVVVFKALVTVHHLMVHGNERFIQHLASRDSLFTLQNFLDNSVTEGPTMSTFIRQYSRYLNEKSLAYRLITSDITKAKRGMDGMMRTMNTKELLNTLQIIQIQFDALINFKANPDELTNGIIHAAFMLLFKDSLCLFAAYNEGIINLLGKFFDMRKSQCEASLDIYIKFLDRTTKLAQFLKVAEEVGIDRNNIPCITQAPHSLLEALKQHLASLEEKNDDFPPSNLQHSLTSSTSDSSFVKASSSQALFSGYKPVKARQPHGTTTGNNLDDSFTSLLENFKFGESLVNKFDVKSHLSSEMEITDGVNWSLSPISIEPFIYKVPLPVACPVTSHHVPMYGMVPVSVGSPFSVKPQSVIYNQPGLGPRIFPLYQPEIRDNLYGSVEETIFEFRRKRSDDLSTASSTSSK
ncbi:phosphatidylinositol-binding clathrin assembly protein-like [Sturnira hondurensis]|uniref:phosphatidylinositol-binding clathrin assembly protein-like n=1 Tax=Sturnira hondurensis TaxID=192404 RepID=UPI001879E879|nr:phosphatidylinositol-binding clathrin assembly protein-like [Sturnira hondurensis]